MGAWLVRRIKNNNGFHKLKCTERSMITGCPASWSKLSYMSQDDSHFKLCSSLRGSSALGPLIPYANGLKRTKLDRGAGKGGEGREGVGRGGEEREGAGRGGEEREGAGRGGEEREGAGRGGEGRGGEERGGVGRRGEWGKGRGGKGRGGEMEDESYVYFPVVHMW